MFKPSSLQNTIKKDLIKNLSSLGFKNHNLVDFNLNTCEFFSIDYLNKNPSDFNFNPVNCSNIQIANIVFENILKIGEIIDDGFSIVVCDIDSFFEKDLKPFQILSPDESLKFKNHKHYLTINQTNFKEHEKFLEKYLSLIFTINPFVEINPQYIYKHPVISKIFNNNIEIFVQLNKSFNYLNEVFSDEHISFSKKINHIHYIFNDINNKTQNITSDNLQQKYLTTASFDLSLLYQNISKCFHDNFPSTEQSCHTLIPPKCPTDYENPPYTIEYQSNEFDDINNIYTKDDVLMNYLENTDSLFYLLQKINLKLDFDFAKYLKNHSFQIIFENILNYQTQKPKELEYYSSSLGFISVFKTFSSLDDNLRKKYLPQLIYFCENNLQNPQTVSYLYLKKHEIVPSELKDFLKNKMIHSFPTYINSSFKSLGDYYYNLNIKSLKNQSHFLFFDFIQQLSNDKDLVNITYQSNDLTDIHLNLIKISPESKFFLFIDLFNQYNPNNVDKSKTLTLFDLKKISNLEYVITLPTKLPKDKCEQLIQDFLNIVDKQPIKPVFDLKNGSFENVIVEVNKIFREYLLFNSLENKQILSIKSKI